MLCRWQCSETWSVNKAFWPIRSNRNRCGWLGRHSVLTKSQRLKLCTSQGNGFEPQTKTEKMWRWSVGGHLQSEQRNEHARPAGSWERLQQKPSSTESLHSSTREDGWGLGGSRATHRSRGRNRSQMFWGDIKIHGRASCGAFKYEQYCNIYTHIHFFVSPDHFMETYIPRLLTLNCSVTKMCLIWILKETSGSVGSCKSTPQV